eukprot:365993-Chlamydomonas_euryale.AAC.9
MDEIHTKLVDIMQDRLQLAAKQLVAESAGWGEQGGGTSGEVVAETAGWGGQGGGDSREVVAETAGWGGQGGWTGGEVVAELAGWGKEGGWTGGESSCMYFHVFVCAFVRACVRECMCVSCCCRPRLRISLVVVGRVCVYLWLWAAGSAYVCLAAGNTIGHAFAGVQRSWPELWLEKPAAARRNLPTRASLPHMYIHVLIRPYIHLFMASCSHTFCDCLCDCRCCCDCCCCCCCCTGFSGCAYLRLAAVTPLALQCQPWSRPAARQTNRQTIKQASKQTDKETDKQTTKPANKTQTCKRTDKCRPRSLARRAIFAHWRRGARPRQVAEHAALRADADSAAGGSGLHLWARGEPLQVWALQVWVHSLWAAHSLWGPHGLGRGGGGPRLEGLHRL